MSLITRKGVYWRAVALVFALGVTLTLGVVSSGAHATAKRGATKSIAYGSLRTAPPAARALLKRVTAGSAVSVSPRDSRLDSGRTLKRSAASSASFADPAGDCVTDATATVPSVAVSTCDIQSVNVSSTSSGLITFKVGIPGSPALTADMEIVVFIDSDQNPATGGSSGSDYMLDYWTNAGDPTKPIYVGLYKLTSAGPTPVSPQPDSLSASYTSGVAKLTIGAADLGSTGGLDFYAYANSGLTYDSSGNPTNYATAPLDVTSLWSYRVSLPLSAARLQGKFRDTYRTIRVSRYAESKVGETGHETQRFVPQCSSGACWVRAAIPHQGTVKFARSGATYYATRRGPNRCNGSRWPYLMKIKLYVTKGATIDGKWRATNWQGTTSFFHAATKACYSVLVVSSDRGVLIRG